MRWVLSGGPAALQALADLDLEPAPEDYPPALEWEAPVWELYQLLCTQWRVGFSGPVGLDLNAFIPVIQARGWRLETALKLLSAIEGAYLEGRKEDGD